MAALRKRMFTFEKLSQPAADLPPPRQPRIAPANCICRPRSIRFLDSHARPETIESLRRTTGEFHEATYSRDRRPVMCGGTGAGASTRVQHTTDTGAARHTGTGDSPQTRRADTSPTNPARAG